MLTRYRNFNYGTNACRIGREHISPAVQMDSIWSVKATIARAATQAKQTNRTCFDSRGTAVSGGECILKKLASLGFGRQSTPVQKTLVIQKLRNEYLQTGLLSITQLARATFYIPCKAADRIG